MAKEKFLTNRRKMAKQSKLFSELFEEDNASLERDLDTFSFNDAFEILQNSRVYYEGVEASAKKQPVTDNPYPKNTQIIITHGIPAGTIRVKELLGISLV